MHLVYKITFLRRKKTGQLPYLYIGSKANCTFDNGTIYDNRGNAYYGSSTYENYKDIVKSDICTAEILYESDDYQAVLRYEAAEQEIAKVVTSPEYFNKTIAAQTVFHKAGYGTYKHAKTGKVVKLAVDDPMVCSGEYVGVTAGSKLSDETKLKISRSGEENGFYGRIHTKETRQIIGDKNRGNKRKPEDIEWFRENVAKAARTPEWRSKIGRSGFVMLKNVNTGEVIRIHKDEVAQLDLLTWINPLKYQAMLGKLPKARCEHCNMDFTIGNLKRWHGDKCKKKPLHGTYDGV